MQETAQQYTQRLLGYVEGKDPLRTQQGTPAKLAALIKGKKSARLTKRPAPGKWSVAEILAHYTLRAANVALLRSVPKKLWDNHGMHSERGKETISYIVHMVAGHDMNHLRQIEGILKSK